jgi:hypothetical protein
MNHWTKLMIGQALRVFATSILLCGTTRAGKIEYPALGNFDLNEGTLEIWLTPMTEMYPENPGRYRGAFSLFSIRVPDRFSIAAGWGSSQSEKGNQTVQHRLFSSMSGSKPKELLPVVIQPKNWKQGQPQHYAITWQGKIMKAYSNGKRGGGRSQSGVLSGNLGDVWFILGDQKGRDSRVIVHAVRLSSIARSEEQLANAKPVADVYTRLLDVFDSPNCLQKGMTKPVVMTRFPGGSEGGRASKGVRFTQTPTPGLALYLP